MVLLLIKTYLRLYFINEERRKKFYIKFLIIALISFFILSYFNFKSNIIGLVKTDIGYRDILKYIYLILILNWFSIGIFKRISYSELIPYLNLPIKRNALLLIFILRSSFDFVFLFFLLINLTILVFFMKHTDVRFYSLMYLLLIYSIIPQQIGMALSALNMKLVVKFLFVLFFVMLTLIGYKASIYFNIELIKSLTIPLIIFFGIMIQITKTQLSNRLIDYL